MRTPHAVRLRRMTRRLRILLATRPLAYWSLTLVVAVGAGAVAHRVVASAEDTRRSWGTTRPAIVVTRPVAAGAAVDATNTAMRALPSALVPASALTTVASETVAAGPLDVGEVLTSGRVGRPGRSPVAALLPEGTRGVAIATPPPALALRVGDIVDVIAAAVAVHHARVVRVADDAVVVAVPEADGDAVARAVADGSVQLALAP